ncbi:MAG: hypothetical protein IID61_15010 [SAR324 cluster bacterium]|nr:hypothetical protein [SAR324 cluster bacterium]
MTTRAYRVVNGQASDLGFYPLLPDDPAWIDLGPGDDLPAIESLHSPAYRLSEAKAERVSEIKAAGFARVHQDFPPHTQRRLLFKATTDTERKACAALIETVKAEVDKAETAILAAADEVAAEAAQEAGLAALAAL